MVGSGLSGVKGVVRFGAFSGFWEVVKAFLGGHPPGDFRSLEPCAPDARWSLRGPR